MKFYTKLLKTVFMDKPPAINIHIRKCSVNSKLKPKFTNAIVDEYDVQQKLLKVAVVGVPNVGKSTFINYLMDRKVCPTSSKVHTTRSYARAVFTLGDSQIVFLDNPGLVNHKEKKRFKLEDSFVKDCEKSLNEADLIGVIHDVGVPWSKERLDIKVINLLQDHMKTPSFLIFNKVDLLKSKRKLLELTRMITDNCIGGKPIGPIKEVQLQEESRGWPHFKEIFMVSSLTGDGLSDVKDYLIKCAKPGKWMFPADVWSDQMPETIVTNSVKATLLDFLQQEIPYQLETILDFFEMNDEGVVTAVVVVKCPTERIARLIAGASDGRLRQMTTSVQKDLQDAFQQFVRIQIVLESPKGK